MKNSRIEIENKDELNIKIKASSDPAKQAMLFAWMILWTIAGLGIVYQFFQPGPDGFAAYTLVWFAFWAYFEYKVIYAYRWRRRGCEHIEVKEDLLILNRLISGRGMDSRFDLQWINNLRLRDRNEKGFIYAMSKAYWNPGDEALVFDYKGKEILFGMDLEEAEAAKIVSIISKRIKSLRS